MKRLLAFLALVSGAFAQLAPPNLTSRSEVARTASTPADFVWMPGGSSGVLVTAASQTATTFGTFTGYSWNLNFHSPLQHTRGYPGSVIRPTPFLVGSTYYDGAGFNQIEFDLSAALVINSSPLYEDVRLSFPAGVKSMAVSSQITFAMNAGSTDVSLDVLSLQTGGAYAVAQYNVTTAGLQRLRVETQGGARGQNITIPDKVNSYVTDLRIKAADNYGIVALINPLTSPPTLIGTSGRADTYGADLASLQIQSYLLLSTSGGGKLRYGPIGFMPTALPFPSIKGLSIAAPTSVAAIQTASGQVAVSCTSITQQNTFQYSSDGGTNWTTAVTAYDPVGSSAQVYYVTGLSDSTSYLFRVIAVAGDQTSPPSSTASVTTNNGIFITPNTATFDGSTNYMSVGVVPTGIVNSKVVTLSFWMNPAADGVQSYPFYAQKSTGGRFRVVKTSANKLQVLARNSSNTVILDMTSTSTFTVAGGWKHVYMTFDLNAATSTWRLYINQVADAWVVSINTNDTIEFQPVGPGYAIGADSSGANKFNGALAEVWFRNVYLDTVTAFSRVSQAGVCKPITITATSPAVYFSLAGSGNTWATDSSGNGNNYTVTGTLGTTTPP